MIYDIYILCVAIFKCIILLTCYINRKLKWGMIVVKGVVYKLEDMFEGLNVFLGDYFGGIFEKISFESVTPLEKPVSTGLVRFKVFDHERSYEVKFLSLLPGENGPFFWKGKPFFSPLVLVEKKKRLIVDKKDFDLDDFYVIPGYFLEKALVIGNSLHLASKYIENLTNYASLSREEAVELFQENLSATLSRLKTGAQLMKLTEKRWIKVPILFPLSEENELLKVSELRKVVYHGEKVPELFRKQHPSHLGRVDLLETPESEAIGLVLFMASGAKYDPKKLEIIPANSKNIEDLLSPSTRVVPFMQHSDSTRVMMGGKNIKQAVRVTGAEVPKVKTGIEDEIDLSLGVNAFVGYSLYYGLNFEDGIVVSDEFARKMAVDQNIDYVEKDFVPLPDEINITIKGKKIVVGDKKLRIVYIFKKKKSEELIYGDVIAERHVQLFRNKKWSGIKDLTKTFVYDERYPAKLLEDPSPSWIRLISVQKSGLAEVEKGEEIHESCLEITIPMRIYKPLEVGDKITGRHGNKGTISRILPKNEMPYVVLEGEKKHLDMILSPLGIITRMNLGQLLETQGSLAGISSGKPFEKVDVDLILAELKKLGADRFGRFELHLNESKKFPSAVGYQYFVRLDHNVRDKLHVVSRARISSYSFQPLKGRKNRGGQRIGEMEFWTLFDHGAVRVIDTFAKTNLKKWKEKNKYISNLNYLLTLAADFTLQPYKGTDGLVVKKTDPYKIAKKNKDMEELETEISRSLLEVTVKLRKWLSVLREQKDEKIQDLFDRRIKLLLAGKDGYIRKHMLGRRIHYSGRATIVPVTDIDIDHVYLPVDFAIEWFSNLYLAKELRRNALMGDYQFRKEVAKIANEFVRKKRFMVLLNRQPSLHRHSIQASYPVFWENFAIGLPIMLCEGFGADFDGDTMAVYFPIDQEKTVDEMKKMLPSNHPFRIGNRDLVYSFEQDMVYGHYLLTGKEESKTEAKKSLTDLILKTGREELLQKLLEWQNERFKIATEKGLSLSLFEVAANEGYMKDIVASKARGKEENFKQLFGEIELKVDGNEAIGNFSKGIAPKWYLGVGNKENFMSCIAVRGRSSMMDKKLHVADAGYFTRKMVEFLYPLRITNTDCGTDEGLIITPEIVEVLEENSFSLERLILGRYVRLKDDEDWTLVTRDNVEAFRGETFILRSPVTCEDSNGVCSKCAGLQPSMRYEEFKPGDYIGVTAGHSIGERGTQLSMKTFQIGVTDFKMSKVARRFFKRGNTTNYLDYLVELSKCDIWQLMADESTKERFTKTSQKVFEIIDIASIHLEILFREMLRKGIESERDLKNFLLNPENYGAFSSLSFERAYDVAKELKELTNSEFIEKSPKSYYAFNYEIPERGEHHG